jgi:hypothetical protein
MGFDLALTRLGLRNLPLCDMEVTAFAVQVFFYIGGRRKGFGWLKRYFGVNRSPNNPEVVPLKWRDSAFQLQ